MRLSLPKGFTLVVRGIMSTDAVSLKLKQIDREAAAVEKRLSFMKRFARRYANGRMFIATQLFEYYGVAKGFMVASSIAGKGFWPAAAMKFPLVAGLFTAAWDHATTLFEGAVAVAVHSSS